MITLSGAHTNGLIKYEREATSIKCLNYQFRIASRYPATWCAVSKFKDRLVPRFATHKTLIVHLNDVYVGTRNGKLNEPHHNGEDKTFSIATVSNLLCEI
jgi:hypothetical protein